jgi:hypothetical protein
MATTYDVCLVVWTESLTLSELTLRLGLDPSGGSHSKGEPHLISSRGQWKSTMWQLCSRKQGDAPLEEHFDDIVEQLQAGTFADLRRLVPDAEVFMSVGVFSNSQVPAVDLTRRCLDIADAHHASIEVKVYVRDRDSRATAA